MEVCEWMMYLVGISNDHRFLSVVFKLMDVCLWNGVVEGSWLWFILCGVGIQNGFMVYGVVCCWLLDGLVNLVRTKCSLRFLCL